MKRWAGRLSWGCLGAATAALVLALTLVTTDGNKSERKSWVDALLLSTLVGLVPTLPQIREKAVMEGNVRKHQLMEEQEQELIKTTTRYNPQKTIQERAHQQIDLETRIMNVFNSSPNFRLSSCVESSARYPKYRRYLCEFLAQVPGANLGGDNLIDTLRREMQIEPNRDGSQRGIMIHSVISGTRKFAIDIERHEDDPSKDNLLNLKQLIPNAPPLSLEILIGFDFEKDRLLTKNVEEDDVTHLMVSGATRSGKSVWLRSFLNWLISNYDERQVNLVLADLKVDNNDTPSPTFGHSYDDKPHLKLPVLTCKEAVLVALGGLLNLMDQRNRELSYLANLPYGHQDRIEEASIKALHRIHPGEMPHIFFVIEEAGQFKVSDPESGRPPTLWQAMIEKLMALGASAGIHVVLAYQKATHNEVSYQMQGNAGTRISLKTADPWSGAIALGYAASQQNPEAMKVGKQCMGLAGKGDLLLREEGEPKRLQGLFSNDPPRVKQFISEVTFLDDNLFAPVEYLEKMFGSKSGLPILLGLASGQSGEQKQLEESVDQEERYALEQERQAFHVYIDYMKETKDRTQRNFSGFQKRIAEIGGIGSDRRKAIAEKVIQVYARNAIITTLADQIKTKPAFSEDPERLAVIIIDEYYGTKNGTGHEYRMNHRKLRATEEKRLEWARGVVADAIENVENNKGDEA